jgi:hypothetical protein
VGGQTANNVREDDKTLKSEKEGEREDHGNKRFRTSFTNWSDLEGSGTTEDVNLLRALQEKLPPNLLYTLTKVCSGMSSREDC